MYEIILEVDLRLIDGSGDSWAESSHFVSTFFYKQNCKIIFCVNKKGILQFPLPVLDLLLVLMGCFFVYRSFLENQTNYEHSNNFDLITIEQDFGPAFDNL